MNLAELVRMVERATAPTRRMLAHMERLTAPARQVMADMERATAPSRQLLAKMETLSAHGRQSAAAIATIREKASVSAALGHNAILRQSAAALGQHAAGAVALRQSAALGQNALSAIALYQSAAALGPKTAAQMESMFSPLRAREADLEAISRQAKFIGSQNLRSEVYEKMPSPVAPQHIYPANVRCDVFLRSRGEAGRGEGLGVHPFIRVPAAGEYLTLRLVGGDGDSQPSPTYKVTHVRHTNFGSHEAELFVIEADDMTDDAPPAAV